MGGALQYFKINGCSVAKVIAVYKQGKPGIFSLDILKEFRGENNVHGLPSDPPHPSFQGGDKITEISSSELERLITERIKSQERQLDRREQDPGDRRETAGQTESQEINRLTARPRSHPSVKRQGGAHPTLNLDGEVEMQGGDERGAEHQPDTRLEDPEEPTPPTPTYENEIDMQEGVKRGPAGCIENPGNGKLRRREGIKRGLQDMLPVSYEEYDTSLDLEDQSKRCKTTVNCLLASCRCKRETAVM